MAEAPIWPVATDAFIADTTHLDAEETGAYMMLLMCLWRQGGEGLEDNPKKLARMARVPSRKWNKVWESISPLFQINDGLLTQKRVSKDIVKIRERIHQARTNGERGGRPKSLKNKEVDKATGSSSVFKNKTGSEPDEKLSISISKDTPKGGVPPTDDAELFRRGKEVLGKSAGGVIAKLKEAKGGNVALTRAIIETASTKHDPAEYVGAVIRGKEPRRERDRMASPAGG